MSQGRQAAGLRLFTLVVLLLLLLDPLGIGLASRPAYTLVLPADLPGGKEPYLLANETVAFAYSFYNNGSLPIAGTPVPNSTNCTYMGQLLISWTFTETAGKSRNASQNSLVFQYPALGTAINGGFVLAVINPLIIDPRATHANASVTVFMGAEYRCVLSQGAGVTVTGTGANNIVENLFYPVVIPRWLFITDDMVTLSTPKPVTSSAQFYAVNVTSHIHVGTDLILWVAIQNQMGQTIAVAQGAGMNIDPWTTAKVSFLFPAQPPSGMYTLMLLVTTRSLVPVSLMLFTEVTVA